MGIPVLHAGSLLPAMPAEAEALGDDGYTRRVTELDYDIEWVDLLEMDGGAPYTYSEELPYDELLQPREPGAFEDACAFVRRAAASGAHVEVTAVDRPDVDVAAVEALATSLGAAQFRTRSWLG